MDKMTVKRFHSAWLAILVCVMLALAACSSGSSNQMPGISTVMPSGGLVLDPPHVLTDATLTDQAGNTAHLSDWRGRVALVFFGYTHCPDVCPVVVADWTRVKKTLGADANKASFVFISVDPARDTPPVIKQFLSSFDPAFIGLTANADTIQKIAKDFGVIFAQETGATVAHSTSAYLVDGESRIRIEYPVGTLPDGIAEDMRVLIHTQN